MNYSIHFNGYIHLKLKKISISYFCNYIIKYQMKFN